MDGETGRRSPTKAESAVKQKPGWNAFLINLSSRPPLVPSTQMMHDSLSSLSLAFRSALRDAVRDTSTPFSCLRLSSINHSILHFVGH